MRDGADGPVLALFHGSRNDDATTQAHALATLLAAALPDRRVEIAFLSRGIPSLETSLRGLAKEGSSRIAVVPVFLLPGVHVTTDIAAVIAAVRKDHPTLQVAVAECIGACPELVTILLKRLEKADVTRDRLQ